MSTVPVTNEASSHARKRMALQVATTPSERPFRFFVSKLPMKNGWICQDRLGSRTKGAIRVEPTADSPQRRGNVSRARTDLAISAGSAGRWRIEVSPIRKKTRLFLSLPSMFVPSLSWQNNHFY
jgi:hypothetical protein